MTDYLSKPIDWEETLMGEALFLGLLSKILYTEPDLTLLKQLVEEDVFAEAPFAEENPDVIIGLKYLQSWSYAFQGEEKDGVYTNLKADYMRIMVGTTDFKTPPWESVYFDEDRMIFSEDTLNVRAWYRKFGLAAEKIYNEPDDHIALEISFVAHLASLSLEALKRNDPAGLEKTLRAQHDFLEEHLLRWGFIWCNLVIKNASTDFYRGMALLVQGALTELEELFKD